MPRPELRWPGRTAQAMLGSSGSAITSRPNDGTGYWPDSSNTGHTHAPGYPGSLTDGSSLTIVSNTTYSFYDFSGGVTIGTSGVHADNVTFTGCRFYGNGNTSGVLAAPKGSNITFKYCTFAPNTGPPSYIALGPSYQYAVVYDGGTYGTTTGQLTVQHCDFWGFGEAFQVNGSTQSAPHVFTANWFHHCADPNGSTYHHDGILCTVGGTNETYVVISGNTIASEGNTNAIALQLDGGGYYSHITAAANYLSGFNDTVQIGGNGSGNDSITFTDNVWSTEIAALTAPLYGWGGTNNTWRRNRFQVFPGDPANPVSLTTAADGLYWWPTDNSGHASDYTGG